VFVGYYVLYILLSKGFSNFNNQPTLALSFTIGLLLYLIFYVLFLRADFFGRKILEHKKFN